MTILLSILALVTSHSFDGDWGRLSGGLESRDDLIEDLAQALDAV